MVKNFDQIACVICGSTNDKNSHNCVSCHKPLKIENNLIGLIINGLTLITACNRGFYGLTFKAEDKWGKPFAVKLISKIAYVKHDKDFEQEVMIYATLPSHPCIANYITSDLITVNILDMIIDFYIIQSEWIEGKTIKEWLLSTTVTVQDFYSAATDLLSALEAIHGSQLWHNDLHEENILVTKLSDAQRLAFRRDNPFMFKIVDIGSMRYKSPEAVREIGDMVYLASHLDKMASLVRMRDYELTKDDKCFMRAVQGIINRLGDENPARGYRKPSNALNDMNSIYQKSRHEDIEMSRDIDDPYGLINANDIHSPYLILKMFSDSFKYFRKIMSKDHQSVVITGPRGCGKTMILKYMSFITQFDGRTSDEKETLDNLEYIGLYISARAVFANQIVAILRPPWISKIGQVGLYFNLLITIEIIEVLYRLDKYYLEEKDNIQTVVEFISKHLSLKTTELYSIRNEIVLLTEEIINDKEISSERINRLNSTPYYIDKLGTHLMRYLPCLKGKSLILLVDDLTLPRIPEVIMKTLAPFLFNTGGSYKTRVSAHTDGLVTSDHSGEEYKRNRDYTEINLGIEYYSLTEDYDTCRNGFDDIMLKRFALSRQGPFPGIEKILGMEAKLSNIGQEIRRLGLAKKLRTLRYFGAQIFIHLCSGDISYPVDILGTITARGNDKQLPIDKLIQHKEIRNYARTQLRLLLDIKTEHVTSLYELGYWFGSWSKEKLIKFGKEYTRLEVEIDELTDELIGAMRELLSSGLFIDGGYSNTSSGTIARRLLFRRIFTPAFPTTFNNRNSFSMRRKSFHKFIKNPKNYVRERWSEDGLTDEEQQLCESPEMFDE